MADIPQRPALTVRCTLCAWSRAGGSAATLAAQRAHRQVHAPTTTEGRS